MIRDMTPGEMDAWYDRHQWPCGHGQHYLEGPRGGIMRNITCPKCGMKLNVVDPQSGFAWRIGQVLVEPDGYVPPKEMGEFWRWIYDWLNRKG